MHPTPLRVDEIERILESDLGSIRTLIYIAARVMGKPLGYLRSDFMRTEGSPSLRYYISISALPSNAAG